MYFKYKILNTFKYLKYVLEILIFQILPALTIRYFEVKSGANAQFSSRK